ncbi:GNAT family N-acetyltransferase [Thalassospira lucentensis]|uniref:GNAT family N-acetyltransferase n=1 Tax=Thalassospira lucentensis TaxID=168935 RepID=UPI00142DA382|nr:GNAT family N-acetyltransferase [Thalassospira lucentensis]NIZ02454.1 GNAT family N-acetyltransferase [Thalassospira lucentensis]
MTNDIPHLETDRLVLRAMTMGDWPAYQELMLSERSVHMGGPYDLAGAWGMFCSDVAQWGMLGNGALMIDEKLTGTCVGQVGINRGPLFPEHELGWLLFPEAEGRGIAYEAAVAMRRWAFEVRGLKTLVSYIANGNTRSIKLANRLGATLDVNAARPDPSDLVYRHSAGFHEN